jgi:beta-mannosidase
VQKPISIPAGESNVTLSVEAEASAINLWWAVGMGGTATGGSQPLYNISISFVADTPHRSTAPSVRSVRRIGFRYFALVTGNDTDPAYVASAVGAEGTSDHGMYFRLNGVAVYSKGANMIPMEVL